MRDKGHVQGNCCADILVWLSMRMLKRSVLVVLSPLLMAALAAAHWEPAVVQSDEAEAQVQRVIKAAMDMRLDPAPALDLEPKNHTADHSWYLGGHLVNITGDGSAEEMLLNSVPTFAEGPRIESDVRVESYRLGYRIRISSPADR